jgi:cysteinyl-tRNA synthetase
MHCGFLDLEGAKMSKSLGNVVRLRDALERVDAEALRFFFLSTHYRNPLSFSDKSLSDAEARVEYFYETLRRVDERLASDNPGPGTVIGEPGRFLAEFHAAMDDDFNVPGALAAVSGLFAAINELLDKPPAGDRRAVARTLRALREDVGRIGEALGMLEDVPAEWLMRRRDRLLAQKAIDRGQVELLIAQRTAARGRKEFAEADRIREELRRMGVEIMDTPAGTTWKVIP